MKTMMKIFGCIAVVAVIVFSGAIGKLVGKTAVENYQSGKNEATIDALLFKTASDLNSKLPIMVDAETQLDNTIGVNNTFRYNYTLINYSSSDISAQDINSSLKEKIINNVCTTEEMQIFVGNGVTVSYAYYGKKGKLITVIPVLPSQCKKN